MPFCNDALVSLRSSHLDRLPSRHGLGQRLLGRRLLAVGTFVSSPECEHTGTKRESHAWATTWHGGSSARHRTHFARLFGGSTGGGRL